MAGFRYAIEAGADFIELDIAVTRDDVLVVSHDPVLGRRLWTAPKGYRRRAVVRELTLEELRRWDCGSRAHPRFPRQTPVPGARLPALEEVFELAARGAFGLDLEPKSNPARSRYAPPPERFAALLVETIRRHKLESRVVVQCFDFRLLRAMRTLAPEIRLAALYQFGARGFVSVARKAGAAVIAPYHRLVNPAKVAAAHCAGIQVVPWTANRPKDWDRLIRAGVDGIITDDPAGLIDYLRLQGLR